MIQSLWKTVWRFLKKLKIELPYDPAIPLLGIYPEKTIIQKNTCTPMFIAALFTIARTWKQPKCPSTDKWIKKMWYIYILEYYSARKRNETGSFVETWMDLENIMLSEISVTEKNKYCLTSHIWNLKYNTNESIYKTNRLTDIENSLRLPKGKGMRGEGQIRSMGLTDTNYYA